jgi:hypothetical protein
VFVVEIIGMLDIKSIKIDAVSKCDLISYEYFLGFDCSYNTFFEIAQTDSYN